jgi:uncharacterized protein YceH (UPF0502 family)
MTVALDPTERRIVGSLVEKQLSVPESYPLTLHALVLACNQKSNRDPATELPESHVLGALQALMDRGWVTRLELVGARTVRYEHRAREQLGVSEPELAILAELLLRGPQSAPELERRASRMRPFASLAAVEDALRGLSERPVPYVRLLGRRPGERVPRWEHLLAPEGERARAPTSGEAAAEPPTEAREPAAPPPDLATRVEALEREVAALRDRLDRAGA